MMTTDSVHSRSVRDDLGWLAAIVLLALVIRIYLPWPLVFAGSHVNLLETDAWYHLRVIENLVSQFPFRLQIDPYVNGAQFLKVPPLLDYLVAAIAWVLGFGNPSEALVLTVAVFTAPVLAALTVVVAYAIGRLAGGSLAGLLAAALLAILPGHFLDRTLIGYVDHHALEALMSLVVVWLIARSLAHTRSTEQTDFSPSDVRRAEARRLRKHEALIHSHWVRSALWLGLALCLLRLTWTSAAMLVGVLVVWLVAHTALQSWRQEGPGDTARIVGVAALIALLFTVTMPWLEPFGVSLQVAALSLLIVVAVVAEVSRAGLRAGWWTPVQLGVLLVVLGGTAAVIGLRTFPAVVGSVLGELSRFSLAGTTTSVLEARPLFTYDGVWSLRPVWLYFRGGFVLGVAAVIFLAVRWVRQGRSIDLLLVVWTLAMYAATIGINRFGYYLVPAIAIVGGCACAALLTAGRRAGSWRRDWSVILVAAGAFGVNFIPALSAAQRPAGLPPEWLPAFAWMRTHTDEPFGDADYYHARYRGPDLPQAQSTVMVWWDYGYTVMAAGRRVPIANPTGAGAVEAARFFTETDPARALDLLAASRSRHVVMDELLPLEARPTGLFGKFQAIAQTAGHEPQRFFDMFFVREAGQVRPIYLFFEDYYRSMAFRLGVLGGRAVVPSQSTDVVSWTIESVVGFGPARVVSNMQTFPTYDAAADYLRQLGPGNHAIVGRQPGISAVPLDAVEGLQRVYATPAPGAFGQGAVQIFAVK